VTDTPEVPQGSSAVEPSPSAPSPSVPAPAAPRAPSRAERRAKWWAETKLDLKWATALLFVLVLALSGALWTSWQGETVGEESLTNVSDAFFSTGTYDPTDPAHKAEEPGLVAPFEILSVVLLAALGAGVVIAMRETEGGQ
jgi:hypothetical protein